MKAAEWVAPPIDLAGPPYTYNATRKVRRAGSEYECIVSNVSNARLLLEKAAEWRGKCLDAAWAHCGEYRRVVTAANDADAAHLAALKACEAAPYSSPSRAGPEGAARAAAQTRRDASKAYSAWESLNMPIPGRGRNYSAPSLSLVAAIQSWPPAALVTAQVFKLAGESMP